MTEYILIVAFIAIASITVVTFFGNNIRGMFQIASGALAGEKVDQGTKVKADTSNHQRNIKNFGEHENP